LAAVPQPVAFPQAAQAAIHQEAPDLEVLDAVVHQGPGLSSEVAPSVALGEVPAFRELIPCSKNTTTTQVQLSSCREERGQT